MTSHFSLETIIDCESYDEKFRFNNLHDFKSFKHNDTGLKVNFANVSGPLYTMAVVVPTFLKDNKGKAHTLEHLIFTGSEKYPQRGLLDKLATSCMSSGTNAYTADDHTNYTFSSGSANGLKKLLPVFLDHILHPLIVPETVDMEVFSLKIDKNEDPSNDDQISAQGVVYCEMKGRQNSEADLLDFNLRHELCSRYEAENPVFSRFKWECGGLTKDIATLSIEEIISFHRCFYNPSNISIIICGKMTPDLEAQLLNLISSILKPSESYITSEKFDQGNIGVSSHCGSRVVNFPSNEDNLGSVGLAWPGASAKDLIKVLSFHVIFKYLRETSSSPLYQKFVQIENPLATDIDYEIKPLYQTVMTLIFSGVPHNSETETENGLIPGKIKSLLKEVLISLSKDLKQFEKMMQFCLCSFELKLVELMEDDPYETIVSYTVPNLVSTAIDNSAESEHFGSNLANLKLFIAELKSKPVDYWISLLQYLINIDPVEVVMIPDVKLNDEIEKEEKAFLHDLWSLKKARVAQIPEIKPYSIESNFELMSDSQMTPFIKSNTPEGLHVIQLPGTGMKHFIRLTNFKHFIPENLWSFLVLFQELLFQCDVELVNDSLVQNILQCSDDKISYQLLQKTLNSIFNSYGINFGIENDTFSLGYCEEALSWTVTLPSFSELSLNECIAVLEAVATRSILTAERIKIIAENLYNQIQDIQKDPYEIIESILTFSLHDLNKPSSCLKKTKLETNTDSVFENEISMFKQKSLLKKISRGDEEMIAYVLESLEVIKKCIKDGLNSPSFIQIGCKSSVLENEIKNILNLGIKIDSGRDNFDTNNLPKFGRLSIESGCGIAYAIGDITASYMSFVIPCNVLQSDQICEESINEYVSISLICQLLSVTEGPIYSAIRGRGLAYDASLTVSMWNGLLTFAVNDSNDPVTAFKEFQKLMIAVNDEFKNEEWQVISEDSLKVAKSAFLYQMIEESATPASMFNSCMRNYLRSIPMASSNQESDPIMEMIRKVTRADLSRAWFKYFTNLLSGNALTVLAVPKSICEIILTQFNGLIDFKLKTFNDFSFEDGDDDCDETDDDDACEDSDDDDECENSDESDISDEDA